MALSAGVRFSLLAVIAALPRAGAMRDSVDVDNVLAASIDQDDADAAKLQGSVQSEVGKTECERFEEKKACKKKDLAQYVQGFPVPLDNCLGICQLTDALCCEFRDGACFAYDHDHVDYDLEDDPTRVVAALCTSAGGGQPSAPPKHKYGMTINPRRQAEAKKIVQLPEELLRQFPGKFPKTKEGGYWLLESRSNPGKYGLSFVNSDNFKEREGGLITLQDHWRVLQSDSFPDYYGIYDYTDPDVRANGIYVKRISPPGLFKFEDMSKEEQRVLLVGTPQTSRQNSMEASASGGSRTSSSGSGSESDVPLSPTEKLKIIVPGEGQTYRSEEGFVLKRSSKEFDKWAWYDDNNVQQGEAFSFSDKWYIGERSRGDGYMALYQNIKKRGGQPGESKVVRKSAYYFKIEGARKIEGDDSVFLDDIDLDKTLKALLQTESASQPRATSDTDGALAASKHEDSVDTAKTEGSLQSEAE